MNVLAVISPGLKVLFERVGKPEVINRPDFFGFGGTGAVIACNHVGWPESASAHNRDLSRPCGRWKPFIGAMPRDPFAASGWKTPLRSRGPIQHVGCADKTTGHSGEPELSCRFACGRTRRTRKCEAPMRRRLGPTPQALLASTSHQGGRPDSSATASRTLARGRWKVDLRL